MMETDLNNKIIGLLSICLITVLSHTKVYALTSIELGELIECKASYQDFIGLGLEYEEQLKSLGWIKDTLDNLDIYRNQKMLM